MNEIKQPNNKQVSFSTGEILEFKGLKFKVTKVLRNKLLIKLIH